MEPILWFVGIMVLLIAISIVRNTLNPPRDLEWNEVPEQIREAISNTFSEFEASKTRYIPVSRKYKIRGQYRGRSVEVEIEGNADGTIRELELEDLERGLMQRSQSADFENLPAAATEHLKILIGPDLETIKIRRLTKGDFNGEPAYTIKGSTENAHWEIEITAEGRLIEVEKNPRP